MQKKQVKLLDLILDRGDNSEIKRSTFVFVCFNCKGALIKIVLPSFYMFFQGGPPKDLDASITFSINLDSSLSDGITLTCGPKGLH